MIELVLGLILLVLGGDVLVRHSSALAIKAEVPPLIVGLTVVSICTSSPELFASLQAVYDGVEGIAVGNVIGSNIANLGLALGLTTLIAPLVIDDARVLKIDLPLMVMVTVMFGILANDGSFSRYDGAILMSGLVAYLWFMVRRAMKMKDQSAIEDVKESSLIAKKSYLYLVTCIVVGCSLLYFGSETFIKGASKVMVSLGVSELVIGVTVVAFGTSVPEIVASVMAALKKEGDLGIGNLIGSNIMNILLVLGGSAIGKEIEVESSVMKFDFPFMLGTAVLLYPIIKIGKGISRIEGAIYVSCYLAFIYFTLV